MAINDVYVIRAGIDLKSFILKNEKRFPVFIYYFLVICYLNKHVFLLFSI